MTSTNFFINGFEFKSIYTNQFASVSYNHNFHVMLCEAKSAYIPIAEFKDMFTHIQQLLSEYKCENFIFDKTSLNTFHQPSMEWYFTVWKVEAKKSGLVNHYKILPPSQSFVTAVEAGKNAIFQRCGKGFLEGIKISYLNSIDEILHDLADAKVSASS